MKIGNCDLNYDAKTNSTYINCRDVYANFKVAHGRFFTSNGGSDTTPQVEAKNMHVQIFLNDSYSGDTLNILGHRYGSKTGHNDNLNLPVNDSMTFKESWGTELQVTTDEKGALKTVTVMKKSPDGKDIWNKYFLEKAADGKFRHSYEYMTRVDKHGAALAPSENGSVGIATVKGSTLKDLLAKQ